MVPIRKTRMSKGGLGSVTQMQRGGRHFETPHYCWGNSFVTPRVASPQNSAETMMGSQADFEKKNNK